MYVNVTQKWRCNKIYDLLEAFDHIRLYDPQKKEKTPVLFIIYLFHI